MSRYLPAYQYDIFVSYAHVDNEPGPGADHGWISHLLEALQRELDRKLGQKDSCEWWLDKEKIRGHESFPPTIVDAVKSSAILFLILSPGYIRSEWCGRESHTFLRTVKEKAGASTNVFIVEMDKVDREHRPQELRDLNVNGYQFWTQTHKDGPTKTLGYPLPRPDDGPFNDELNRLAYELAEHLRTLDKAQHSPPPPPAADRPAVFLAEVTEDLEYERDLVEEHLKQEGLRVLPDTAHSLCLHDPGEYQAALDRDLEQCGLFVQLLSGVRGRKPKDLQQGYPRLQYERAKSKALPILQWRPQELTIEEVKDPDHRALLEMETVWAERLEEFKREVVKRAQPKPKAPDTVSPGAFVLVDIEKSDQELGQRVAQALSEQRMGWALPDLNEKPGVYRRDLENHMANCDGFILVYGNSDKTWARDHMMWFNRVRRTAPWKATALLEGPPESKDPVNSSLPGMLLLNCRKGLCEGELQKFIQALS